MGNPTVGMFVGDAEIERRERNSEAVGEAQTHPVEDCICHKGSVCTMPACGLFHHKGCSVHGNYHSFPESSKSSSPAQVAAREIAEWIFTLEKPLTSETDLRVAETVINSFLAKHFPVVQDPAAQDEIRSALEGMVSAFNTYFDDEEVARTMRECAMSVANQALGWPNTRHHGPV